MPTLEWRMARRPSSRDALVQRGNVQFNGLGSRLDAAACALGFLFGRAVNFGDLEIEIQFISTGEFFLRLEHKKAPVARSLLWHGTPRQLLSARNPRSRVS